MPLRVGIVSEHTDFLHHFPDFALKSLSPLFLLQQRTACCSVGATHLRLHDDCGTPLTVTVVHWELALPCVVAPSHASTAQ
jgi:hypothetical protein